MKKTTFYIVFTMFFCSGWVYASQPSQEKVVATVNGVEITQSELNTEMNRLIPMSFYHQGVNQEKLDALQGEALNHLIEKELKYQYARGHDLKVKNREVNKELKKVIEKYPNKKAFNEQLEKSHFTREDVKEEIKKNQLVELSSQIEVIDKVHIGEEEAKEYYENNKQRFVQPVQISLKNILIKVPPLANDFEQKALQDKAAAVARKIKEGLAFEDAVQQYSEESNKERGGDMGLLHKGRLAAEVEEVILTLQPGDIAGPFKVLKGFYIFRMEGIHPEKLMTFEEVKGKLIKDLMDQAIKERERIWLEELKSKAEINVVKSSDKKSLDSTEK